MEKSSEQINTLLMTMAIIQFFNEMFSEAEIEKVIKKGWEEYGGVPPNCKCFISSVKDEC